MGRIQAVHAEGAVRVTDAFLSNTENWGGGCGWTEHPLDDAREG
jgi:hypothetical protein